MKYILTSDYTAKRFSNVAIKNPQEKSFLKNDIIQVKEEIDNGMNKRLLTTSTPNGSVANTYVLLDFDVTNAPMKLYSENNANLSQKKSFFEEHKNHLFLISGLLVGYFIYKKYLK